MFTVADIRNIAIQIERNGEETYRKASKAVKDPHIAKTLDWMADEESQHAEWFESITSSKPLTTEQQELEAMGKTLLQDMMKGNNFLLSHTELKSAENIKELLEKSKYFEEETILFYEFLLGFLDDEETSRQLKIIIQEEQCHIKKLESLEEQANLDEEKILL